MLPKLPPYPPPRVVASCVPGHSAAGAVPAPAVPPRRLATSIVPAAATVIEPIDTITSGRGPVARSVADTTTFVPAMTQ